MDESRTPFSIIAAVDEKNGLGKNNTLVWKLPTDMRHFSEITTHVQNPPQVNVVIMGRKTWESIPGKHRPLKNRINIILSRTERFSLSYWEGNFDKNPYWLEQEARVNSLENALRICDFLMNDYRMVENVFIIGGAMLYSEAINHPECQNIYLTRIHQTFDCDAFFPPIDEKKFQLLAPQGQQQANQQELLHENNLDFEFLTYVRKQ